MEWAFISTNIDFADGYLADIHNVDGQALDPTDFGEFDATLVHGIRLRYSGSQRNQRLSPRFCRCTWTLAMMLHGQITLLLFNFTGGLSRVLLHPIFLAGQIQTRVGLTLSI